MKVIATKSSNYTVSVLQ